VGVIIAVSLTNPRGNASSEGRAAKAAPGTTAAPSAPSSPEAKQPAQPQASPGKGQITFDPALIRFGEVVPRPKAPGTLRVTTFNVENLFDDKDDPALTGDVDDAKMTKATEQLKAAAAAIALVNPDVLALQEVESLQAVTWFRDNHLAGQGYDHIASIDAGDGRGIEQAVLSRFPLSDVKNFPRMELGGKQPASWGDRPNERAGRPFVFTRSPMQVTVTVPTSSVQELLVKAGQKAPVAKDYKVTLLVVHLKSGREFGEQRTAEAEATVRLVRDIEKADHKANVLVLGDFNATLNREEMVTFSRSGLASIFQERDPRDAKTMTHASGRCIDHVLFNANVQPELVLASRFVLGTPARPQGADWRTTPAPPGYSSDHYPVSVDLRPVEAAR
jgi:endonuclease/exonuclease/phosphatase family metal-dependent hydrolase